MRKNNGGFIQIIVLIIIVLVIGQLLGYGPLDLWQNFFLPILKIIWAVILFLVNLLTELIRQIYSTIK
jgi:hypothetical protein